MSKIILSFKCLYLPHQKEIIKIYWYWCWHDIAALLLSVKSKYDWYRQTNRKKERDKDERNRIESGIEIEREIERRGEQKKIEMCWPLVIEKFYDFNFIKI